MARCNDSPAEMIARQSIHLSLFANTKKGGGYNVADARTCSMWSQKWPKLCAYFGLKGVGPPNDNKPLEVNKYIDEHMDAWKELGKKRELKTGNAESLRRVPGFMYAMLSLFDFDREYDMTKIYSTGFTEERTTIEAWGKVFDRMKEGRIIPDVSLEQGSNE